MGVRDSNAPRTTPRVMTWARPSPVGGQRVDEDAQPVAAAVDAEQFGGDVGGLVMGQHVAVTRQAGRNELRGPLGWGLAGHQRGQECAADPDRGGTELVQRHHRAALALVGFGLLGLGSGAGGFTFGVGGQFIEILRCAAIFVSAAYVRLPIGRCGRRSLRPAHRRP